MNPPFSGPDLEWALAQARRELIGALGDARHWAGELSSSALSTATAICALSVTAKAKASPDGLGSAAGDLIARGCRWLVENANEDGGWGDTIRSISNISTTVLCWAALGAVETTEGKGASVGTAEAVKRAEEWIGRYTGGLSPAHIARAILERYGKDRTFSVPILTMAALSGRLGRGREAWKWVLPLPFELAAFPPRLFALLRLPVVSYALPALIAMGQTRHFHAPSRNPFARWIRQRTWRRTSEVLAKIQPPNGGFLEAVPLTSFVVMSLASSGRPDFDVTRKGLQFLMQSARPDGSWPIDTNLTTWVTTLSLNALGPGALACLAPEIVTHQKEWLLGQQFQTKHPYTNAAPGGWAWTDLPGGVPDADDTAGALLALSRLGEPDARVLRAVEMGVGWLLDLQNRDGGMPTFCRGWGNLPFDRSGPDLTAHALRAWLCWRERLSGRLRRRIDAGARRGLDYLLRTQRSDGSWLPLWFGNQFEPNDENPIYGTARVILAFHDLPEPLFTRSFPSLEKAIQWLLAHQSPDGSWSGTAQQTGTVEETAVVVESLAAILSRSGGGKGLRDGPRIWLAAGNGVAWLGERVRDGTWTTANPIGFYFAKLWYFEKMYPLCFCLGALERAAALFRELKRSI